MKRKLLAALVAALLLLTGCQYTVIEDADEQQMGLHSSAAAEETAPTQPPLQKGDRDAQGADDIQALQQRLIDLNYLDGKADGIFGSKTEEALAAFQARNGLEESGQADADTLLALESALAVPMPTPEPTPLADGAKGDGVREIQEQLRVYGFLTGSADGDFGAKTDEAVKLYQQYVYEKDGEEYLSPTPTPTPSPSPTPSPTPDPSATVDQSASTTPDPTPTPEPTFSPDGIVSDALKADLLGGTFEVFREVLERGSRDADGDLLGEVQRLQRRLYSLLYLEGSIDGIFGGGTQSALKYFQKRNNLEQTGIADETTQRLLFSADAKKSDRPNHMYMLKVSVADQKVYAYKWVNGSYSNLVRTMVCSTGTTSDPTPTGTFSNGGPAGRWYYFQKFDCWAQYAWRINGPYLFHSVLYSEKDTSTLRQSSVNNLGRRASHGCIRLKVEDAKWIYNNCSQGTTVKIV